MYIPNGMSPMDATRAYQMLVFTKAWFITIMWYWWCLGAVLLNLALDSIQKNPPSNSRPLCFGTMEKL